ncbi:hypothetical protein AVEN_271737-1 [Araneus ventricosus]|uniref:Uncharacterized protein n=1 Tax=Araneus ventricosus TaxID=182803 RepID=A0A4Y2TNB9_ARAVE|nr:hypothetical protein AVEN_271737-1 [Araneus ventricosus]
MLVLKWLEEKNGIGFKKLSAGKASIKEREGFRSGWSDGVKDHPRCESPIHGTFSQKLLVLKWLEEKNRIGFKELSAGKA